MAQDIEEFLRMAAARKKQQAQAQQGGQPAPQVPQPAPPTRPPSSGRSQSRKQNQPAKKEPDLYIGAEEQAESQFHTNLESRIRPTVSTEDIAEHASHLGDGVHSRQQAYDRVERKFDHELGRLVKRELKAPATVDHGKGYQKHFDLTQVIKMLQSPQSARQAFILKEIFDRPEV